MSPTFSSSAPPHRTLSAAAVASASTRASPDPSSSPSTAIAESKDSPNTAFTLDPHRAIASASALARIVLGVFVVPREDLSRVAPNPA